jgi:hypothetical protein
MVLENLVYYTVAHSADAPIYNVGTFNERAFWCGIGIIVLCIAIAITYLRNEHLGYRYYDCVLMGDKHERARKHIHETAFDTESDAESIPTDLYVE